MRKIQSLASWPSRHAQSSKSASRQHLELLYHVTKEDSVLGSVERSTAHRDQILHRSGMIFLARFDGRILLQHRSPNKTIFPDCWDSSSSFHVTFGETYEQAARRELTQETKLTRLLHPRKQHPGSQGAGRY